MTDDELNIAICKARGWTYINNYFKGLKGTTPDGRRMRKLPDHINGIEALGHMHEAEKILTREQATEYSHRLYRCANRSYDYGAAYLACCCTAKQRAVALARTLNIYKE